MARDRSKRVLGSFCGSVCAKDHREPNTPAFPHVYKNEKASANAREIQRFKEGGVNLFPQGREIKTAYLHLLLDCR